VKSTARCDVPPAGEFCRLGAGSDPRWVSVLRSVAVRCFQGASESCGDTATGSSS